MSTVQSTVQSTEKWLINLYNNPDFKNFSNKYNINYINKYNQNIENDRLEKNNLNNLLVKLKRDAIYKADTRTNDTYDGYEAEYAEHQLKRFKPVLDSSLGRGCGVKTLYECNIMKTQNTTLKTKQTPVKMHKTKAKATHIESSNSRRTSRNTKNVDGDINKLPQFIDSVYCYKCNKYTCSNKISHNL